MPKPTIVPLGDQALLVRFATSLDDGANRAALNLARQLDGCGLPGAVEISPNLVSVLVRYDRGRTSFPQIAGEIRLLVSSIDLDADVAVGRSHVVRVSYGGAEGPDLESVSAGLGLTPEGFAAQHAAAPLRVLSSGFAPGFVYCGMHGEGLALPRRTEVRRSVPAGSVLFAARLTALTSMDIPTGWHVIGRADFSNFDPEANPPSKIVAGDLVTFEAVV